VPKRLDSQLLMLTLWHKFTTEDVRQRVEHWLASSLVIGTKDASLHSVVLQLRVQHAASRMIEEGFLRYRNWEPRRAEMWRLVHLEASLCRISRTVQLSMPQRYG
jgi:hypothetical protein